MKSLCGMWVRVQKPLLIFFFKKFEGGKYCWGPFPWWLVFHNWRQSFINAIICGGLSPTNWRHFFPFAINHGKCSCLYLQRMPINWHSMKRRKSSQSLIQFLCFEFPFESQESSRREEGKMRGSENRGCSLLGISTPGRV